MKILFDDKDCDLNKDDQIATIKLIKSLTNQFETKNLTVLFTNSKLLERNCLLGMYIFKYRDNSWYKKLGLEYKLIIPVILVDTSQIKWIHTFFHELGHHLDKRPKPLYEEEEKFANEFADIMYEKYLKGLKW